jgi:hypothetical protein
VYVVALVAVHMIVLGVANILRVIAEIALAAPSGGFTGLPFVFADFNQPRELYREQASLAIALLAVGTPAWWWHIPSRPARGAGRRGARLGAAESVRPHRRVRHGTARLRLRTARASSSCSRAPRSAPATSRRLSWSRGRVAGSGGGAAAMALAAAIALAFHLRLSMADRRATLIAGRAAEIRHLASTRSLSWAFCSTTFSARRRSPTSGAASPTHSSRSPGRPPDPQPATRRRSPATAAAADARPGPSIRIARHHPSDRGWSCTLARTWIPQQRGLERGPDAEIERRSVIRKLAIYLIVFVSSSACLSRARSRCGHRPPAPRRSRRGAVHEPVARPGQPVSGLVIFGPMWLFHRRVIESDAARESEVGARCDHPPPLHVPDQRHRTCDGGDRRCWRFGRHRQPGPQHQHALRMTRPRRTPRS